METVFAQPPTGTMEVLLLQDIPEIGKKDDLLVVGDGYALNYLLPAAKAIVATPTVRRRYAEQIKRRAEERIMEQQVKSSAATAVAGKVVEFSRKVTKTGKLYAAITEKHIAEEMKKQHSIEIDASAISIAEPIKALGDFEVTAKFGEAEEAVAVKVVEEVA